MRFQHQTSFGGKDDPEPGNCWSTCIAMLIGMDTKYVPNFCGLYRDDQGIWYDRALEWLSPKGVLLYTFDVDPTEWHPTYGERTVAIASGPGPRGHDHCVLWKAGRLLYDPHPSGDGLFKTKTFDVLVISDPDLFGAHLREQERQPQYCPACNGEPGVKHTVMNRCLVPKKEIE